MNHCIKKLFTNTFAHIAPIIAHSRSAKGQRSKDQSSKSRLQTANSHLDEEDVEGDEEHSEDHPHKGRKTTQTVTVLVQSDHLKIIRNIIINSSPFSPISLSLH